MLRVAVFSLAGIRTGPPQDYITDLSAFFKELRPDLAVLPAHLSFILCASTGQLDGAAGFAGKYRLFIQKAKEWNSLYYAVHQDLARSNGLYLAAGTTVEKEAGLLYHTACCFGPDGQLCGQQRQTHLSREERAFGFSRGEELSLFELAGMKAGFIVGTDARHPEVGRILALEGAALVIHPGAIVVAAAAPAGQAQQAGIWAQVQQNQFWAAEAQLKRDVYGRDFNARSALIGPCEITPGLSGYLAGGYRTGINGDAPFAVAELPEKLRLKIKKDYPLLKLLRPEAYRGLLPELYR